MFSQYNPNTTFCDNNSADCSFWFNFYEKGTEQMSYELKQHMLLFCKSGHIRITSNLFKEEFLCTGEILFIPRGTDYHGVALSDSTLIVHYFNNAVCRIEDCVLSYLFTLKHTESQENKAYFYSKLTACGQLSHLMSGVDGYLSDEKYEPALWGLKHKELIWLFTKYYSPEELRLFFHSLTDEQVPFKSMVLAHYRKAEYTDTLAEMCGYGLYTFRRLFKKEFGISPYKWLTMKRAEHVRHRLSFSYIPFCDIIDEFHFSSAAHFSNFCKQFLGDTPSNLRMQLSERSQDD